MDFIKILKAQPHDLKEILRLSRCLFENEINKNLDPHLNLEWIDSQEAEGFFLNLIKDESIFLALLNDTVVGYLAGIIHKNKLPYNKLKFGEIFHLYLDEKTRGVGLGKRLMEAFKERCLQESIHHLKVTASAPNRRALSFYQNNGFNPYEITLLKKI